MAAGQPDIPWQPDNEMYVEDFHNYKGWYSILVVELVNNHYMFAYAEVGRPNRISHSTATHVSYFNREMQRDNDLWLVSDGILIGDGGGCGMGDFITTLYPCRILTNKQQQ